MKKVLSWDLIRLFYTIKIVLDSKLKRMKFTHIKTPFLKIFKAINLFSTLIILGIVTLMTINIYTNLWPLNAYGYIGLVFSWIGGDVFWSESDTGKIKLLSLDSATKTDYTIYSNLNNPRDLAIDPHNEWVIHCELLD